MNTTPKHSEMEAFTEKLIANERITLFDKNYFRRLKLSLIGLLIVSSALISTLFFLDILSVTLLLLCGGSTFGLFLLLFILLRRTRSASIKGDTLILNGLRTKPTVTSIRSVRKARTYRILWLHCTILHYSLDGRLYTSLLFGNPPGASITLDTVILHAVRWNKKQKANHKPGSVATP
jgi:hypothetical protein